MIVLLRRMIVGESFWFWGKVGKISLRYKCEVFVGFGGGNFGE